MVTFGAGGGLANNAVSNDLKNVKSILYPREKVHRKENYLLPRITKASGDGVKAATKLKSPYRTKTLIIFWAIFR